MSSVLEMGDVIQEDVHQLVAGLALQQLGPPLLPALHHRAAPPPVRPRRPDLTELKYLLAITMCLLIF